jgi:hypothetical protein
MVKKVGIYMLSCCLALFVVASALFAAPADQPRTGQTVVISTGDDGSLQAGVAWPNPRFTNSDGSTPVSGTVVIDQLTGLMWTSDAQTPGPAECSPGVYKTWQGSLDYMACLNTNTYLGYSDWRLPNLNELESLVHSGQAYIATWLNTQGFTNAQANSYWSSTTYAYDTNSAWIVGMGGGVLSGSSKAGNYYVWPVRAGL